MSVSTATRATRWMQMVCAGVAVSLLAGCRVHSLATPRDTFVLPLTMRDTDLVCLQRGQDDVTMPCRSVKELRAYFFYTAKAEP